MPKAMKVAHLTTVDLSLRYLVLPQLLAVTESGGEAIGISAPGPYVEELEALGIRHIPIASSTRDWAPFADVRAAAQLYRILRRERPDVLHTHNPKPGIYGRIAGRLAGVPIVVNTIHGLYATPDDSLPKRAVVYLLEWFASRFSDAELAQSPEDIEVLSRLRLIKPSKLDLLGNGVDLRRFNRVTAESRRARTRDELRVSDSEIVVGAVGRLVEEKGYPELFEAIGSLGDGYTLVVAGPTDTAKADALSSDSIEAASAMGVRFLGMRADVEALYGAFDIFVLPSHREGFPRAAMEAAASGLPLVATDIRGCRQVVSPGENGILVPVRDPEALSRALERLGSQPELRERMGKASECKARSEFDEDKIVDRVMATYRRVAADKSIDLASLAPEGEDAIDAARPAEAAAIARMHLQGISQGFLSSLGHRVLRLLYESLIEFPDACVLVARVRDEPVGFIAGCTDTSEFYRHFLRRRALRAVGAVAPALARPAQIRRMIETLRYGTSGSRMESELLAMAVAPGYRRRGIGQDLVRGLLRWADSRELTTMAVVVGAGNRPATALYREAGFGGDSPLEVHSGEPSIELVWHRS